MRQEQLNGNHQTEEGHLEDLPLSFSCATYSLLMTVERSTLECQIRATW